MRLYVMRHAEALQGGSSDAERALSTRGPRQARDIARQLLGRGAVISQIWSSPLRRARETSAILADDLGRVAVKISSALSPGVLPRRISDWAAGRELSDGLLIVAHQPDIGMLAHALGHPDPAFSPADLAAFEKADGSSSWRFLFHISGSAAVE